MPAPDMPKGFIEVSGRYHTDPTSASPEALHLVNVNKVSCVEKTQHDKARIKLNGYWLETDLSYADAKAKIKEALS